MPRVEEPRRSTVIYGATIPPCIATAQDSMHSLRATPIYSSAISSFFIVVATSVVLTWLLRLGISQFVPLDTSPQIAARDYAGNVLISLICFALCQRRYATLVLLSTVLIGFHLANAGKLVVLGTPINPDDFIQVRNLFWLWDGWLWWATLAAVLVPTILVAASVRWRSPLAWITLVAMAASFWLLHQNNDKAVAEFDRRFGHSEWNQPENYRQRGLALHVVIETARSWKKIGNLPSAAAVELALNTLHSATPESDTSAITTLYSPPRNVHLILMETFWDPTTLGKDWVPNDPFPSDFRALWAETGHSTVLAPVFGGYTANSEFEVLCGFPITEHNVFFQGALRNPAPCLPRQLSELGYRTVASHPNVAGFWNRANVYPLIGFEEYWADSDFDLRDRAGPFLLDHSLYKQVFNRLEAEADSRPVFNYILTYHGHLPYPKKQKLPRAARRWPARTTA